MSKSMQTHRAALIRPYPEPHAPSLSFQLWISLFVVPISGNALRFSLLFLILRFTFTYRIHIPVESDAERFASAARPRQDRLISCVVTN